MILRTREGTPRSARRTASRSIPASGEGEGGRAPVRVSTATTPKENTSEAGLGGSPWITCRSRSRLAGSGSGTASTRALVYGCVGALKMRDTGPCSTTRPAYLTASWSHILATMPRLWVMKIKARPCARCSSRRRFRYWAWIVRSRLVVGSSAINRRGSHEMPMAPTMRWRMPPDISCGYCVTRVSGDGMRTAFKRSRAMV